MSRSIPFLGAFALSIALFALGAQLHVDALRLATKALPVAILAVWVARAALPGPFRSRLVFGLALCAVGDLVLELGYFVPGLVAFLVGHLGYAAAFLVVTRAPRPLRALPFALFGVSVLALLRHGLGPMALPVALYTTAICLMMWRAAAAVSRDRPWATPIAVGAVVFAASDTMIAVSRFSAPFSNASVLIMTTYWLGQVLIAAGGVRMAETEAEAETETETATRG
ncbi:MAG TPA: lysoplasmalogenase [Polyangiaceae bacterium]|nr:lysoplasmalogenase [Polyangiaceae bacterium]